MANFIKADQHVIGGNEGGYNPGIGENQTLEGIDRGENPHWSGWAIVDQILAANKGATVAQLNKVFYADAALQQKILAFYKAGYWDVLSLDKVTDQQLANNLFDCSVNQGEGLARRIMQEACNQVITATNNHQKLLTVDLLIGNGTLGTFNTLSAPKLNAAINALRLASYQKDSEWPQWGKVWQKRLINYV